MYHYVRDRARSRFPRLNALASDDFSRQLTYLGSNFAVVSVEDIISAMRTGDSLPCNALLLTFDDGYRDHYDVVLPRLIDRGWSAAFFPIGRTVAERRVLDFNKVHFILAAAQDIQSVISALHEELDLRREHTALPSNEVLVSRFAKPGRLDPAEATYVKRLLQRELPEGIRRDIADALFRRFVTEDEAAFAEQLYMSEEDLRALIAAGMHVGSHGYEHIWLDRVDRRSQEADVDRSLLLLDALGEDREGWTFCYPYGGLNDALVDVLRLRKCALGFTTEMRIGEPGKEDPLRLPRVDTVYVPTQEGHAPPEWAALLRSAREQ